MRARLAGLILTTGSVLCFGQPKQPPAGLGPVQSLIDSGRLAEARRALAALDDPEHPAVRFTAAVLAYREGYFGSALQMLGREPSLAQNVDARILRAATLDGLGRDAEAERELESLVSVPGAAERPLLHFGYGQLLLQRGANEEALARFDQAIRLAPGHADARMWRAIALMRLGRTKEAVVAAESAEGLSPDSGPVHSLLAKLYRLSGDSDRAARQLRWLRERAKEAQ